MKTKAIYIQRKPILPFPCERVAGSAALSPARNIENIMNTLIIYAQKQTTGDVWLIGANGKREAIYPADHNHKPTRKQKNVTLNCCKWKLVWLPNAK